jgi:hypothetical protein
MFSTYLAISAKSFAACVVVNDTYSDTFVLYAGQHIEAGTVSLTVYEEALEIIYTTINGWELVETHAWVGDDLAQMPQTNKGNPKPGLFPYTSGDITGATSYVHVIPLADINFECPQDEVLYHLAAHAALRQDNGEGGYQTQTGWSNGEPLVDKGNWATYSNFMLSCFCSDLPDTCDVIYAVHDELLNDTQFLTITNTGSDYSVAPLGSQYLDHDIEGLAIDLLTGRMYGSSGDDARNGNPNGYLYEISRDTGELTSIGSIIPMGGYTPIPETSFRGKEVSAIAFNSMDGILWGWVEKIGLITIDTAETVDPANLPVNYQLGSEQIVYPSDLAIEEITWTLDGDILYAAAGNTIYRYQPATSHLTVACSGIAGQIEAMTIMAGGQYQGTLWLSFHNSATMDIRAYDPVNCTMLPEAEYPPISVAVGEYDDIEGIAWYCE